MSLCKFLNGYAEPNRGAIMDWLSFGYEGVAWIYFVKIKSKGTKLGIEYKKFWVECNASSFTLSWAEYRRGLSSASLSETQ